MTLSKTLLAGVAAATVGFAAFTANAVPILDGGWASDTIEATNLASDNSPYVFTLMADAWFRITDALVIGDTYTVFNTGDIVPLLVTSFQGFATGFGDNATADFGWTSADYGSAEILLAPGNYSLEIFGDGAGGLPASFFTRLDTVAPIPLPAGLPLLAGGIAAIAFVRRKKRDG